MKAHELTAIIFMKQHSERVPGKNLRSMAGKPLCHWILESLENVSRVRRVIVNTDCERIADACLGFNKVTIHERPPHLLGDHIGASPLIEWDVENSDGEHYLQTHSTNPKPLRCC